MDSTPAVRLLGDRSNLSTNLPPRNRLCSLCSYDLVRIILTMNNFTFNSKHYLQKHGTTMGTKMAPSYANLFLGKFEHDALLNSPYQPHIWLRFIDDIFMIWTEGPEKLKILTIYTPPLTSHARILLLIYHSLMSWFLSRTTL